MFELWIEVSSQSFKYMVLWNCLMMSSWILWNHIFFVGYHLNFFLLYNKNNSPQTMFERTCIYQNFKHLKRLPIKLFWNANQQICIAHDTLRLYNDIENIVHRKTRCMFSYDYLQLYRCSDQAPNVGSKHFLGSDKLKQLKEKQLVHWALYWKLHQF